jgi:hypothetical protein
MHMKGLGLGGLLAVVALVGCGSSGNSTGTGGNTGTGGTGTTGHAGSTGTAGNGNAGHAGGGGATGAGGAFTTSVPSGTKITGLTSAQAHQLCTDGDNFSNRVLLSTECAAIPAGEGLGAARADLEENPSASNADLQATCTAAKADAGVCPLTGDHDAGADCDFSSVPSTCTATVGDLTTCLNDEATAFVQFANAIPTCSALTPAILNAFYAADGGVLGPADPASCAVIESDACNSDDGGTSASPQASPAHPSARLRAFMR